MEKLASGSQQIGNITKYFRTAMKYYLIAGEASGDLHASNLIRELKVLDANARIRAWGGDLMQAQGAELVKHYRDLAFMGFAEVLANLRVILGNLRFCKQDILSFNPDAVILIDYPGFNLRIAKFLHKHNIPVIYYISPQVWAWKQSRVRTIRKVVDKMLVILPFEKDFYDRHGIKVEFVGHPLLDALPEISSEPEMETGDHPLIALLPGSRKQEIKAVLPIMLKIIPRFPEANFAIAGVSSIDDEFYQNISNGYSIPVFKGQTYDLLRKASAALVTSGTATLETALIGTPEVVCYKGGTISYLIARRLVKVKYISLVNIIVNREVVKELIQHELTADAIEDELRLLLYDNIHRAKVSEAYAELCRLLGGPGASKRAAGIVFEYIIGAVNKG